MTLSEVLHAHLPTLFEDATVRDAVEKMDVYQFPALVVTDEFRRPSAVVTEGDISRIVFERGSVSEVAEDPVINYATKDPTTCGPDMEVSDALHLMLSSGLKILPVVQGAHLLGVVMRCDLMQAILTEVPLRSR
jgi:CBS domain-containing protein